jgi:hypothetical protein
MVPSETPFIWAIEHLSAIGWPALCWCAWKVSKYFERITSQASKTIGQIDTLATNHMPHVEASLALQDGIMRSMDTSLKTIAGNSHRRREDF